MWRVSYLPFFCSALRRGCRLPENIFWKILKQTVFTNINSQQDCAQWEKNKTLYFIALGGLHTHEAEIVKMRLWGKCMLLTVCEVALWIKVLKP